MSGGMTPGRARSASAPIFAKTRLTARSWSSPTLKRTVTSVMPSPAMEYTYSTPGTCHISFSIGRVRRFSTSVGAAPGSAAITSIIGTEICGSSSRGVASMARMPTASDAKVTRG